MRLIVIRHAQTEYNKQELINGSLDDDRLSPEGVASIPSIINNLDLNMAKLIEFGDAHDFDGLHVFTMLQGNDAIAAVRAFAPSIGIDEEAATGTTNGSLLAYLLHAGVLPEKALYKIEQGEAMGQLSFIYGKFENDRVWIGGHARGSTYRQVQL